MYLYNMQAPRHIVGALDYLIQSSSDVFFPSVLLQAPIPKHGILSSDASLSVQKYTGWQQKQLHFLSHF